MKFFGKKLKLRKNIKFFHSISPNIRLRNPTNLAKNSLIRG